MVTQTLAQYFLKLFLLLVVWSIVFSMWMNVQNLSKLWLLSIHYCNWQTRLFCPTVQTAIVSSHCNFSFFLRAVSCSGVEIYSGFTLSELKFLFSLFLSVRSCASFLMTSLNFLISRFIVRNKVIMYVKWLAHCLEHSKHWIIINYILCHIWCLAKYYFQRGRFNHIS